MLFLQYVAHKLLADDDAAPSLRRLDYPLEQSTHEVTTSQEGVTSPSTTPSACSVLRTNRRVLGSSAFTPLG